MNKLIEIHKNGINVHYPVASYYGVDYETKKVIFKEAKTFEDAKSIALKSGYNYNEIQLCF